MAKVRTSRRSFLRNCEVQEEQVLDTVFTYWEIFEPPAILEQDEDITHTCTGQDRIDSLANRYYQDSRLWWVIAQANDLDDPVSSMKVGLELTIPNPRYVLERVAV